jgi:hypothetical protein
VARSEEDSWRGDGSLEDACTVAESAEEGGSGEDCKAEDEGRQQTDSNSVSSFRCNAVSETAANYLLWLFVYPCQFDHLCLRQCAGFLFVFMSLSKFSSRGIGNIKAAERLQVIRRKRIGSAS